jgi:peroxiredoxin Q/BCP
MLSEGQAAPGFTLPDQDGNDVSLEDLRGQWVVLWWFPKAFTAG